MSALHAGSGGVQTYRLARFWYGVGAVLILAVIAGSLAPLPQVGLPAGSDKLEHAASYAVLMFWFASLAGSARRQRRWALALLGLGIALEFLQRLVPYRDFEVADMIAGGAGVGLGWLAARTPARRALEWLDRVAWATVDGNR